MEINLPMGGGGGGGHQNQRCSSLRKEATIISEVVMSVFGYYAIGLVGVSWAMMHRPHEIKHTFISVGEGSQGVCHSSSF